MPKYQKRSDNPNMGRPKIMIDKTQLERLLSIPLCYLENAAAVLNCSPDTVENFIRDEYNCTFSELKKQKTEGMKMTLAAKQLDLALKGDRVMLIWAGKQYLGQSDKHESKSEVKVETDNSKQKLEELKAMLKEEI